MSYILKLWEPYGEKDQGQGLFVGDAVAECSGQSEAGLYDSYGSESQLGYDIFMVFV